MKTLKIVTWGGKVLKVCTETGLLSSSERFFFTPSKLCGQMFFYITRCGHYYCDHYDFCSENEIGHLETHRNFLIQYICSGTLHLETDSECYTASKDQVTFFDCRKPHRYFTNTPTEMMWFHFNGFHSQEMYDCIMEKKNGCHVFTPFPESQIPMKMAALISLIGSSQVLSEAYISQAIYALLCGLLFPLATDKEDNPILRAQKYIMENLHDHISISDIAENVGFSSSHFSRLFRSSTGFSPYEYITLRRIDEAKNLLCSTDKTVKEITDLLGYQSEMNFIHAFKTKAGTTPSAFRGAFRKTK